MRIDMPGLEAAGHLGRRALDGMLVPTEPDGTLELWTKIPGGAAFPDTLKHH